MDRKLQIRKFYEQGFLKFQQQHRWEGSIISFKSEKIIATGGFSPDEYEGVDFSEDEILFFEEQRSQI